MEAYQKINFEDSPSTTTPLSAANLDHMEDGIAAATDGVTALESSKLSAAPGAVDTENLADESITVEKVADDLAAVINAKEVKSNKKTTLTGNESSNDFYPTTKAVADALSTKAPASTAYTFDTTTTNVVYNAANPKTIYLGATVDGESGIILTTADNSTQFFFGGNGTIRKRAQNNPSAYGDWETIAEKMSNKKNAITNANKTSTDYYPSIKAVADYLTANYLGSGDNTVSWANLAAAVQTLINGKESASNKLTSIYGIDSDSTDTEYPTAKAVFDFGGYIVDLVNEDKEFSITEENKSSTTLFPAIKAVVDYVDTQIARLAAAANIELE